GAVYHEDQGCGTPRAQVLGVDRWLHPRVPVDVPADVDLQGGVRRVRAVDRAPQVLLSVFTLFTALVRTRRGKRVRLLVQDEGCSRFGRVICSCLL
ncbi:unnamed protein product, partial [Ectocarpus sp. 12 AP-2014]